MPREWTPEQRAAASERCRQYQPWRFSTGAKTKRGKRRSSLNARKPATMKLFMQALRAGQYRYAKLIYKRMQRRKRSACSWQPQKTPH